VLEDPATIKKTSGGTPRHYLDTNMETGPIPSQTVGISGDRMTNPRDGSSASTEADHSVVLASAASPALAPALAIENGLLAPAPGLRGTLDSIYSLSNIPQIYYMDSKKTALELNKRK